MAAVAPVLGVVSAVSGIASANSQAKAQRASVAASNLANAANYANEKAKLAAQQQFADYTAAISNLKNQGLLSQQQLGIQYSNVMEKMQTSSAQFQNQQKLLTQETQAVGDKGIAQTMRYDSAQKALQEQGTASQQNMQVQNQIGQAASQDNTLLQTGMTQADMVKAMAAMNTGNDSWQSTSAYAQQQTLENKTLQQVALDRQNISGASATAATQLAYANDVTQQQKNLGDISANSLVRNSDNALRYAQAVGAANATDIQQQQTNQELANKTAITSLQGAASLDALTNRANQITATQGIQQQSNAAASQFGSQQAALAAQAASIHGANINQYAQLGMAAYQGYGLLSGGMNGIQQAQQAGLGYGNATLHPYNSNDLPGAVGSFTGDKSNAYSVYSGFPSRGSNNA